MKQQDLFGDKRAVAQAGANASETFMQVAYAVGAKLSIFNREFTSIHVRDLMKLERPDVRTHDDRALGAVMRKLARDGYIEATDRVRPSRSARNHNRPVRVWRSLRCRG